MNGRPVKIISMSTSKTGKHGGGKERGEKLVSFVVFVRKCQDSFRGH
jgi:hypothetical protein